MAKVRRICFVTGTRAEFGLMASTLRAIEADRRLALQIVATGAHLDRAHGRTIDDMRRQGWRVDAAVPWKSAGTDRAALARETGVVTARLAGVFAKLDPEVVLVVGDRVEAFAAATAGHLSGRVVAHVHGGDRALGQVDDALRHAITKLAHVHFPATKASAERVLKMGEDRWRVHLAGSPGIDGVTRDALALADSAKELAAEAASPLKAIRYALLVLHPTDADERVERGRAALILGVTASVGFEGVVVVYPNNDPGSAGIAGFWDETPGRVARATMRQLESRIFVRSLPRPAFLGLMRDAAVLIGNSSSGIIEAASFGTPVVDVGPRQAGRERGANVTSVPFTTAAIGRALRTIWNDGRPRRYPKRNIYGGGDTGARIARVLATVKLDERLRRKLIAY